MHNSFFFKYSMLILGISGGWSLHGQQLHPERALTKEDRALEHLELSLTTQLHTAETLDDRYDLMAELRVLDPEWRTSIRSYDRSLLDDAVINDRLVEIARMESIYDLLPYGQDVTHYAQSIGVTKENLKKLDFYKGYELLKKKNYAASLKTLKKVSKKNIEEYKYAQYYCGLIATMSGDYKNALQHLDKVGRHSILSQYTPYYRAVSWYALSDYQSIYKKLASRQLSTNGYQTDALRRIIGYTYYIDGLTDKSLQTLVQVSSPSTTDYLLMGIVQNSNGNYSAAHQSLSAISSSDQKVKDRQAYESAYAAAGMQQYDVAIQGFTQLLNREYSDPATIHWNIANIYAAKGDITMAMRSMQNITAGPYLPAAQQWISTRLEGISDTDLIADLSKSLAPSQKSTLHQQLYENALAALQSDDQAAYTSALAVLERDTDAKALVTELYAIDGVMSIKGQHNDRAMSALRKYQQTSHLIDHKDIAPLAQYYLAYSELTDGNAARSLGHFSKSLALLTRHGRSNSQLKEDIITRIADLQLADKKYREALASYSKALDSDHYQSEYQLYQIATLQQLLDGEYDQIITLDRLLRAYPSGRYADIARYDRAGAYFALGQYDSAQKDYSYLTKRSATGKYTESAMLQLGLIYANAGDYTTAAKYYDQILAQSSDASKRTIATDALKEIYADHEQDTDAYLALAGQSEDKDKALYDLASNNNHEGNHAIAIEQLNKLITEYPDSKHKVGAYKSLGDIYADQQQWSSAVEQYELYLDQKEDIPVAEKTAAIAFDELSDYELFIKIANRKWHQKNEKNMLRLALSQLYTGDVAAAKNIWSELSSQDELYTKLTEGIIDEYISRRQWQDVIALHSGQDILMTPKTIYGYALSLNNTDQYDQGIELITSKQDLLIMDSAWLVKSVILLSDMYYMQGDKASAIGALEGMLASDLAIPPSLSKQAQDRLNSYNL